MADTPRYDQSFTITTTENGKVIVKIVDRITVDDVFLNMVNQEVYRLMTGTDPGEAVPPDYVDVLIKNNYSAG